MENHMSNTYTVFLSDARNPEGPVRLRDGSWVFTEMDKGCVSWVDAAGQNRRTLAVTGLANGLTTDAQDTVYIAEAEQRALLRVGLDGAVETVSTGAPQERFLLPNDLVFGPDGHLYMTDSGIELATHNGIEQPMDIYRLPYNGKIFRIDPATGKTEKLAEGLRMANGIVFGPGSAHLYVNESLTGNVYRYPFDRDHIAGPRELFCNVMAKPCQEYGRGAGPDGMAFDERGNLYVTVYVQGDVVVVSPSVRVVSRIPIPGGFPTNIAFDAPGSRRALVTEAGKNQLLFVATEHDGLPLYTG